MKKNIIPTIVYVFCTLFIACDSSSTIYRVYKNDTDYEIDVRGGFTIPPKGKVEIRKDGMGRLTGDYLVDKAIRNVGNFTNSIIRFKNPKTGKTFCLKDTGKETFGPYDEKRYTYENLSSGKKLVYRITYTFTDADVALADEKTCQEEEERLKKIGKDKQ